METNQNKLKGLCISITVILLLAFSGCGVDQPQTPQIDQFVNIPQKCIIELDPEPIIEPKEFQKGQELEQAKWSYGNYLIVDEDNQKIRAKVKKCQ